MLSAMGVRGSFEGADMPVGWEEALLVSWLLPKVVGGAVVTLSVPPEETGCPLLLGGPLVLGGLVLVLSSWELLEVGVGLLPLCLTLGSGVDV